jgi:hypothetical protein
MNGLRLLRIAAIAVVLPAAFYLSQRITTARGNAPVEGLEYAIGALTLLFFLRALATEYSAGPEHNGQKDLQWGLAIGGVLTIMSRVWG